MSLFQTTRVETEASIIMGAQFGDEAKGKLIDCLAKRADIVVRSQGGNNAGHTIVRDGKTYKLHLVPTGILTERCQNYIEGGVVIDASALLDEITSLQQQGINVVNRLWVSCYSQITLPYHTLLDKLQEQAKGKNAIGTTGRGIGPTYADKTNRIGIRMADFINPAKFKEQLENAVEAVNKQLTALYNVKPLDAKEIYDKYSAIAAKLRPFVKADLEIELNKAILKKKVVLFEGAQGPMLDNTFGTGRTVTAAPTNAGGIISGAAVGPTMIKETILAAKAFTTRVGNGPLPTEWSESEYGSFNHEEAGEVGSSTGRKRRVGWFDAPIVKTSVLCNGAQRLALTKLDILDTYKKIKLCVAYEFEGKRYDYVPGDVDLSRVLPIYEEMDGWCMPTTAIRRYEDLPPQAKAYIKRIEELCEAKISIIFVGPDTEQTIYVER